MSNGYGPPPSSSTPPRPAAQPGSSRRAASGLGSNAIHIGTVFGIPVRIDWTWLIVFVLITFSVGRTYSEEHPMWKAEQHWIAAVITSLLFFLSIFLHEMGHSLVARLYGIEVASITLFIFGGVASIRNEPRKPSAEFWIALAGPVVSVLLALLFFAVHLAAGGRSATDSPVLSMVSAIGGLLALINFALVVFNLIPGFPLDGGRILRSILWAAMDNFERATRISAIGGQIVAAFLIALGLVEVFVLQTLNGLWLAVIGLFLFNAARATMQQASVRQAFSGIRAADLLDTTTPYVSPAMSIAQLVDEHVLRHGRHRFLVFDGQVLRGLITLSDIKEVPREEWDSTSLQAAMMPCQRLVAVRPGESLEHVVDLMNEYRINQVPVVENGVFYGMVTREGLLHLLQTQVQFRQ